MSITAEQLDPQSQATGSDKPLAVKISQLSLRIDDKHILHNINLDIPQGTTIALMGANGAGKSTLLRILAVLMHPTHGSVELFGVRVGPTVWSVRSQIGLIAHQPILYRDFSLRENLEFFGKLYDVPKPAQRAGELLDLVGLSHRQDDAVKTLSRGMTQRVSIARALMHDPNLLLADEPFNGLDAPSIDAMELLIERLHNEGKTVITSGHDIRQSLRLGDTVVLLRQGQVVLNTPADQLDEDTLRKEIART